VCVPSVPFALKSKSTLANNPIGYLIASQLIKVHHLDVYLPAYGNEVRHIEEAQSKLIFFDNDLPNVEDGISVGFFIPS
jgi:hypothetical protein